MIMLIARYTEVLNNLMDNERTMTMINQAMSTYPLYQSHNEHTFIPNIIPTREEINKKILDHYKYREIAFETVGRFIDELEIALNEIMVYYNQLFLTQDQDFNIIYNVDYVKTINREREDNKSQNIINNDTSSSSSSGTNTNKNVSSDTPQNQLSITAQNIDNVNYANNVTWDKNTTSQNIINNINKSESLSGQNTEGEDITETTKGNFGVVSSQDLILKYRETIINIVEQIINDKHISDLFMNIY